MLGLLAVFLVVIVSRGWSAALVGPLGGTTLFLLWRHIRSGIYVSGCGVRVTRFFRSEVVPWDQLVAVEVSDGGPLSGDRHPQILLRATTGAVIRTEVYRGITGRRNDVWLRPNTFDRLVARLRELHLLERQARQGSPP